MLKELRSLSETKKKQVLIVTTIIIMIIVIGAWVAYFNSVIQAGAQQSVAQTPPAAAVSTPAPVAVSAPAPSGPNLWQRVESGFGSIANVFKKPSQYNIQPQGN
jgi:hypothetical protein